MGRAGRFSTLALALVLVLGCVTNPVTGKSELRLMSARQEIQLGLQNYSPMQQAEGGVYDLDPALNRYVEQVGRRLAVVSDNKLPYEFVVLNNSIPNAWALPGGKLAINRGLLTELRSESELAAVLGHEIVHAAAGHSAQAATRGMLMQGALVAAQVAAHDSDYGNIAMMGAGLGAQLINQRYGRGAELEADRYGMKYMSRAGYDPRGAIGLQETFVRLSEGRPADWLSGLFASHPPSAQRVAANRATAKTLPSGGDVGNSRYQNAMRRTIALQPAYKAYDAGRQALVDRNTSLALSKAREAIRLEPREAHFYALRGDAYFMDERYSQAVREYTNALSRRDRFFYYHLQRGLASEKTRNDSGAKRDLEASIKLLPTGPAYLGLGNIAKRAGRLEEAKKYYATASQAPGEIGQSAQAELMRMELSSNPEKYLIKRVGLDDQGSLLVQLENPTGVAVTGIEIGIQYLDSKGGVRQVSRVIDGTLAAGRSSRVALGLGPFTSTDQFRVTIQTARIAE